MLNFIKGEIAYRSENQIVIENGGIGFEMTVSLNTLADFSDKTNVSVFTYMHVREDAISLFGFSSVAEKEMFLKLIDISGIGPKVAMQILSGYDIKTLSIAIATGDTKTLSKIKGLGKKTAELIVLKLGDSMTNILADSASIATGSQVLSDEIADAVFALEALGLGKTEALKTVTELSKTTSGTENLISLALKSLV